MSKQPLFVFITGASGAGKTTLVHKLEDTLDASAANFAYFDSLGVPTPELMVKQYGSTEGWQQARTQEWVERLQQADTPIRVLEGQFNPHFAVDACKASNIQNYLLVAVHCDDVMREARLYDIRHQPELATAAMRHWADFIRVETEKLGGTVLFSTNDISTDTAALKKLIEARAAS